MIWTKIPLDGNTYLYVFPRGGIMSARHRSDILEPIVRPHECAIGDVFNVMQYNARSHTALVAMTFIDDTGISVMNWPARYPDINPTEHTWAFFLDVFDNGRIIHLTYRTLSMPWFRNDRPYH